MAHRWRGVAANLQLEPLTHALQALEAAAQKGDSAHAESACSAVAQAWAAVQAASLAASPSSPSPGAAAAATPAALLSPLAALPAHYAPLLAQALDALAQGEVPDTELATLAQVLPPSLCTAVEQAVDAFDFTRAQQLLGQVQTRADDPGNNI